jgi:hypothetical protein
MNSTAFALAVEMGTIPIRILGNSVRSAQFPFNHTFCNILIGQGKNHFAASRLAQMQPFRILLVQNS